MVRTIFVTYCYYSILYFFQKLKILKFQLVIILSGSNF